MARERVDEPGPDSALNVPPASLLRLHRPGPDKRETAAGTAPKDAHVEAKSPRTPTPSVLLLGHHVPAGLRFSAVVYLLSRVPVLIGLLVFLRTHPTESITSVELRYDGWWYVRIARAGYTTSLRPQLGRPDFHHRYSDWAFYPGYPLVIRGLHELTRLPYLPSALVASWTLGLTAVWAMYRLGEAFGGMPVARASALLAAAWPGSAAFSFPYAEGLFVTATAVALILVHKHRWLSAGGFAGVAAATRPNGLALLGALAVVAAVRLVREHDLRPLAGVAVACAPAAAFVGYGWSRTGDPLVWRHAENLWRQRLDLSTALLRRSLQVLMHPLSQLRDHVHQLLLLTTLLEMLGLLVLLLMAVAAYAVRDRLSAPMVTYAVAALALIAGYSAVASRPRMVLAVLPGFVWLAAWLPRRLALALSAGFLVLLGGITYLWSWQVTP